MTCITILHFTYFCLKNNTPISNSYDDEDITNHDYYVVIILVTFIACLLGYDLL